MCHAIRQATPLSKVLADPMQLGLKLERGDMASRRVGKEPCRTADACADVENAAC